MFRKLLCFCACVATAVAQDITWPGTPLSSISGQTYYVNATTSVAIQTPTTTIYKNGFFFASGDVTMYGAYGYSTDSGVQTVHFTATAVDHNGASFYGSHDVAITTTPAPKIDELNVPRSALAGQDFYVSLKVSDTDNNLQSVSLRWQGVGLWDGTTVGGWWTVPANTGSFTKTGIKITAPTTAGTIRLRVEAWDSTTGIAGDWIDIPVTVAPAPGRGLTGEYFNNTGLSGGSLVTRTDASVNFNWGEGTPVSGVNADNFSVRWTGTIQPRYTESYTFSLRYNDGVRLWVNNQLLIDSWSNHSTTDQSAPAISLTAGQIYSIKVEFYESTYDAVAQLSWQSASQPKEIVPNSQLFVSGLPVPTALSPSSLADTSFIANWTQISSANGYKLDVATTSNFAAGTFVIQDRDVLNVTSYSVTNLTSGGTYYYRVREYAAGGTSASSNVMTADLAAKGVLGEYFANKTLNGLPVLTRTDANIGFDWGEGTPGSGVGTDNFSVRWTAKVQPRYSESYTFSVVYNDGVRLWVNGQLLIDSWSDHPTTEQTAPTISLTAGQKYDLKLEFYEYTYDAVAKLSWQSASQSKEIVPNSQLFPPSVVAPTITVQPSGVSASAGDTVTLSVTATGLPAPTYQWQKDGASLTGKTAASLVLTNVQETDAANYRVVVSNSVGSVTSNPAYVSVIARKATISPGITQTIQAGSSITFSSIATTPNGSMQCHMFNWQDPHGHWSWGQGGAHGLTLNAPESVWVGSGTIGSVPSSSRTIVATAVDPGTYTISFSMLDSAGWKESSFVTLIVTTDTTLPTTPSNSHTTATGLDTFTVAWNASSDNVGVTEYEVRVDGVTVGTTTNLSFVVQDLTPNSEHVTDVRARDAAGNRSVWSTPFTATLLADTSAPDIPSGLEISLITATSLQLSWNASADNVETLSYEVYMNGSFYKGTSGTSLLVDELRPAEEFTFKVRARDYEDNVSGWSSDVSGVTIPPTQAGQLASVWVDIPHWASDFTQSLGGDGLKDELIAAGATGGLNLNITAFEPSSGMFDDSYYYMNNYWFLSWFYDYDYEINYPDIATSWYWMGYQNWTPQMDICIEASFTAEADAVYQVFTDDGSESDNPADWRPVTPEITRSTSGLASVPIGWVLADTILNHRFFLVRFGKPAQSLIWTAEAISQDRDPLRYYRANPAQFEALFPNLGIGDLIHGKPWDDTAIVDLDSFFTAAQIAHPEIAPLPAPGTPGLPPEVEPNLGPQTPAVLNALLALALLDKLSEQFHFSYVLYDKSHKTLSGKFYSGRTFGHGADPVRVLARRDRYHTRNVDHFPAKLKAYIVTRGFSTYAERAGWGREQQMIDSHGGFVPNQGYLTGLTNSTNGRREVGKGNIFGYMYWLTSNHAFGPLAPYTGYDETKAISFVWPVGGAIIVTIGVLP